MLRFEGEKEALFGIKENAKSEPTVFGVDGDRLWAHCAFTANRRIREEIQCKNE